MQLIYNNTYTLCARSVVRVAFQAMRESVDLCFAISDGLRMHNGTLIGADDVASRLIGHNVFLRSESDTYRHGNTLLRR